MAEQLRVWTLPACRDSWGRQVDEEVALRVQLGALRALPLPWSPPMPDFDPDRVMPRLVAEACADRLRSLVPGLKSVGLHPVAAEMGRLLRLLDAYVRIDAAGGDPPSLTLIEGLYRR